MKKTKSLKAIIKIGNIHILTGLESKSVIGAGVPNIHNPSDWAAIYSFWQLPANIFNQGTYYTPYYVYRDFLVTNDGFIRGDDTSPNSVSFAGFTPYRGALNASNKASITGDNASINDPTLGTIQIGNNNGQQDDGLIVPFYAFVRYIMEYFALSTPTDKENHLTNWYSTLTSYQTNQQPVKTQQDWLTRTNLKRYLGIDFRNDIPRDNDLDDDPYGYLQGYDVFDRDEIDGMGDAGGEISILDLVPGDAKVEVVENDDILDPFPGMMNGGDWEIINPYSVPHWGS